MVGLSRKIPDAGHTAKRVGQASRHQQHGLLPAKMGTGPFADANRADPQISFA